MKVLLKLAIVALLANATWHAWGAYSAHFKFKDAVESASQGSHKADQELRSRVLELAAQYDVPLTDSDFTLQRDRNHTIIDGAYGRPIEVFPGIKAPFNFHFHVDTFTLTGDPNERR
jgi:hypothetical protein